MKKTHHVTPRAWRIAVIAGLASVLAWVTEPRDAVAQPTPEMSWSELKWPDLGLRDIPAKLKWDKIKDNLYIKSGFIYSRANSFTIKGDPILAISSDTWSYSKKFNRLSSQQAYTIGIGYYILENTHLEFSYTYRNGYKDEGPTDWSLQTSRIINIEYMRSQTLVLTLHQDFPLFFDSIPDLPFGIKVSDAFVPYLGIGVGYGRNRMGSVQEEMPAFPQYPGFYSANDRDSYALQLVAGMRYELMDGGPTFDMSYRYVHLGKFQGNPKSWAPDGYGYALAKSSPHGTLNTHELSVTARHRF